jgi:hypothetical protein
MLCVDLEDEMEHLNEVRLAISSPVMTVRELADYLRVHQSTIYRLLKQKNASPPSRSAVTGASIKKSSIVGVLNSKNRGVANSTEGGQLLGSAGQASSIRPRRRHAYRPSKPVGLRPTDSPMSAR